MSLYAACLHGGIDMKIKEPLKMNVKDTVTTDRNDDHSSLRRSRTGEDLVCDGRWANRCGSFGCAPLANRQRAASVELKSSSEYEMNMTLFILFRLYSVSKFPIVHCNKYTLFFFFFPFILKPEVIHKPSFSGEPSFITIQLKTWIFWQRQVLKCFLKMLSLGFL